MDKPAQRSVLVMGGLGRFGHSAVRSFAAQGWRVLAQVRPTARVEACAGVEWLRIAPDDAAALVAAAAPASVVVHALNPPYTAWETQALPLLEASLRVAGQLHARVMLPGNVYNFGSTMPAVLDENTQQRADTRKGRIRVLMEQRLQQQAQATGIASVVVRAGDFFGNGRGSWFDLAVVKNIRRGKMTYPGALDVPTAWAYLPDLASAFVRLADKLQQPATQASRFDVFHFQGHALTGRQWATLLSDVAIEQGWMEPDQELATGSLPWPLIKAGGLLVPAWRELTEMRYLWQTPHAMQGAKLAAMIGPEPRTPLTSAVRDALCSLGLIGASACAARAWA